MLNRHNLAPMFGLLLPHILLQQWAYAIQDATWRRSVSQRAQDDGIISDSRTVELRSGRRLNDR